MKARPDHRRPPGIATVSETRALEADLIETWGLPVEVLMERAALGVASVVADLATADEPIAVLVGPGHNGGDAAGAARMLRTWGYRPEIYAAPDLSPVTAAQVDWAGRCGAPCRAIAEFRGAPVIADGLFGFGLNRAPAGALAEAIKHVNECSARAVVAVDLPSGTHGDTGVAPGDRVKATHTVATGLVKVGVACDPAADAVGDLWAADIGLPPTALEGLAGAILAAEPPPRRPRASHKGTFGTLLVIGGSRPMVGAPGLAALGAGRSGAGLVIVAVPRQHAPTIAGMMPEALVVPLDAHDEHSLDERDLAGIAPWLERADAVVLGPGLGRGPGQVGLVGRLWAMWDGPLVLDADALGPELASVPPRGPVVVTPHPGEAARMLGTTPAQVQGDRLATVRHLAANLGVVCVLKGARTLVARPDGRFGALLRTTPALATAGSGDVLCGFIGGHLAQGQDTWQAACQAVARHADLGLLAAARGPGPGLLARDLLDYRGALRKSLPGPALSGSLAIRLS